MALCYLAIFLLALSPGSLAEEEFFNILSCDGGGIRGLISATVIDYMENYAYEYARETYKIPEEANKKLPMSDLFQMMAGTSTGSLITGSLSMPLKGDKKKNKFFAPDIIQVFTEEGDVVFTKPISYQLLIVCWALFTIIGMVVGYQIGVCLCSSKEVDERIQKMDQKIKNFKDQKKQGTKAFSGASADENVVKGLLYSREENWGQQLGKLDFELLKQYRKTLQALEEAYVRKSQLKWLSMAVFGFVFFLLYMLISPSIQKQLVALYDRSGIESICNEKFEDVSIREALTEELLITSFEYQSRTPVLFTKHYAGVVPDYDHALTNITQSSSAAPIYFPPKILQDAQGNDLIMVDGGIYANDPALFSYMHAKYNLGKKKLRIISVGTGTTEHTKISPDPMAIEWVLHAGYLLGSTEQYSHGFLVRLLAEEYHMFQIVMEESIALDSIDDSELLMEYGRQIVENQREELQKVCRDLVDQWAKGRSS